MWRCITNVLRVNMRTVCEATCHCNAGEDVCIAGIHRSEHPNYQLPQNRVFLQLCRVKLGFLPALHSELRVRHLQSKVSLRLHLGPLSSGRGPREAAQTGRQLCSQSRVHTSAFVLADLQTYIAGIAVNMQDIYNSTTATGG